MLQQAVYVATTGLGKVNEKCWNSCLD